MKPPPGTVSRYTPLARVNHWITAACLILLALSGLALFDPALFFLTALFGGGPPTRAIHPWIGVVLIVSFAGLFVRFARYNAWTRDDTRWLGAWRSVINNDDEHVPEVGRYNAGQKLYFWMMSLFIVVLFVTGLVMWDKYFFPFTSIPQKRAAVFVHSLVAVLSIMVWIVHVYAALWVRGTVQAMTRGFVTAGWSWRHHRKWLRAVVARQRPPASTPGASTVPGTGEHHPYEAD